MSRKISLLTRAGSLEPEVDFTTESPAPKRRTVRFAGLDSPSPTMPTGRRPKVVFLLLENSPVLKRTLCHSVCPGGDRWGCSRGSALDSDIRLDRSGGADGQVRTTEENNSFLLQRRRRSVPDVSKSRLLLSTTSYSLPLNPRITFSRWN